MKSSYIIIWKTIPYNSVLHVVIVTIHTVVYKIIYMWDEDRDILFNRVTNFHWKGNPMFTRRKLSVFQVVGLSLDRT